jgi:hypothetical protein
MSLPFMRKLNPFKPTDIGGCQLWLDSTDSSTVSFSSGSNVSQWRDKSGSSNHFSITNGTTSYISDNGMSVISFPSGAIMSSANQITFTTSSAFYIVSRINSISGAGIGMLLGFTNINGADKSIRLYVSGTIGISLLGTAGVGDGNELANNNYFVNGSFNPSFGSNVYLNVYSIIGTVAPQSGGTSFLTLSSSFMSRFFIGNIAEFIYYPAGITNRQREQIEGYLAQKWGLQANLPAGSPGRTGVIYPHTLLIDSLTTGQPTQKPFIRSIGAVILGGSFQFTTTPSQYLSIPNNAGFTQNTAFTYELWYYPTSTDGGYIVAMLQHNWITIKWAAGGAGTIGLDMSYVGNPPGYVAQNRTYAINRWHHIALSWNGTNGVLYMNGVSEAVFTGAGGLVNDGNDLRIGQYQGQGQQTPLGYFTNIRFVKGVSVYTGAFTPPTGPLKLTQSAGTNISAITAGQTQLLILATNSAGLLTDSSTNNFTITNNGSVSWNALTPFS